MKLLIPVFSLILTHSFLAGQSQNQGFLKADGKKIVNGKGDNVLLRGVGLGGWMLQEGYMLRLREGGQQYRIKQRIETLIGSDQTREFYTAWLSNHTTKSDIDSLHAWGFNSVRLPMHYNLFTLPVEAEPEVGKNSWLTIGFDLTDSLIKWCKANNMYVFLDLHAAPGGQGNDLNISDRNPATPSLWQSEANQQKTIALWRKIAGRYAEEPTVGGYDLLNEPNWGFEDTLNDRNGLKEKKNIPLRKILMEITQSIREVDKKHIIIIEGNGWGNNYSGLLGPWDNNMVLSFHKYWNHNDQQSIQYILNYRNQYNIPVWLGETGENSNTWFTEAIRLLETNNIGWAWWPLKKLGNNNPLQVKSNPRYDALVNYWNGKTTTPPTASDAFSGLMELAANTKNERNIVQRDVIDAMIRQPFSQETEPFRMFNISTNTLIQAVDYDLGANGYAYIDMDTANYGVSNGKENIGNRGRTYRNDGVDIFEDSSRNGHFYVGHIEDGEWLQFTIQVAEPGQYQIKFYVSSDSSGGLIELADNGSLLKEKVKITPTGTSEKWETMKPVTINLNHGIHRLRVNFVKGGFNFISMSFSKISHSESK